MEHDALSIARRVQSGNAQSIGMSMAHCPLHDDEVSSLHISLDRRSGRLLFYCHAGCDQQLLAKWFIDNGFQVSPDTRPPFKTYQEQYQDMRDELGEEREQAYDEQFFNDILDASVKNDADLAKYLNGRCIDAVPKHARFLSPGASRRCTLGPLFPAMVLPIIDGEYVVAVQVTWLTRDCTANLKERNGKNRRRCYGPVRGHYIALARTDSHAPLIIGEGVESTLSAMQVAGLPGISAINAGNLPHINPPPASEYIIARDNNEVGQRKANELGNVLIAKGHTVSIAPPPHGEDWNDAVQWSRSHKD